MASRRTTSLGVWVRIRDDGAERLKRRRLRNDLTQRDLAFLARCSQNTIHLLETGKMRTLSDKLATQICKKLDLDLEDIFIEQEAVVAPKKSMATCASGLVA